MGRWRDGHSASFIVPLSARPSTTAEQSSRGARSIVWVGYHAAVGVEAHLLQGRQAGDVFELGRQLRDWLDPRDWEEADVRERFRLTVKAHDWIRRSYGAEPKLLFFAQLPPDTTGEFHPATGRVMIDPELLFDDDPLEVLRPLAHENRHDVQNGIIEEHRRQPKADPGTEVRLWDEAKSNYTTRDSERYHYNALEVDAREAEAALERGYLRRHIEHLSGTVRSRARVASRNRQPHRRDLQRWDRERGA